MMPPNLTGPLDGVTVLDLCSYLAGPYGCTLLADLGATVIKIESPQGDMLRQFPSSLRGDSRFFLGTNRGKRAIALDLKQPEGLAVLHRMVGTADVLVENFRPPVPARLGIDYPRLKAINPASRLLRADRLWRLRAAQPKKGGFDRLDSQPRGHAADLLPELRTALAARTAVEWEEIFGERVPCAAVRPIEDMFDHPQVIAEDLVTTLDHPVVGHYRTMTKPWRLPAPRRKALRPPG